MATAFPDMNDPRAIQISSHLAPTVVRVGGITGDWFRYIVDDGEGAEMQMAGAPPPLGEFWPNEPQNFTMKQLYNLTHFITASNLSLLFDLSELYGRNCNTTKPGCPTCPDWCGSPPEYPAWDTSNVRVLLQRLHDDGTAGGDNSLFAFELGNELVGHLDPVLNTQDILALSGIIDKIWGDSPNKPDFFAPSTDNCWAADTYAIMKNVTGAVAGFTYHAYPGGDGHNFEQLLLNSTWLRTGIMTGSNSIACINGWNAGPRASGMDLWITEASSSCE